MVSKYEYPKCLLCIKHLKIPSLDKSYLLAFGTDGDLLFWKINFSDEETPQKIPKLNQSGINDVDIWQNKDSDNLLIATVGDDTCLSVANIQIDSKENINLQGRIIKNERAHASCIVGK